MNQTTNYKRIIGGNDLQEVQTCIDSYHAVHMDMRGHTGVVSSFDIGVLTANSSRHNIN